MVYVPVSARRGISNAPQRSAGYSLPVANWDGIPQEMEVDMAHYKPIQTSKPPRLSEAQLQRLMDFCERFVELPKLEVVDRTGVRITLSLRQLLQRDPYTGWVPLRPDWKALDVAYMIAGRCFKEYWGCPEEQIAILATMEEPDLAALLISRLLMRLYHDSTDPRHKNKVLYVAHKPQQIRALADAFYKRAGWEKYTGAVSKQALHAQRRSRNPEMRKLTKQFQQRYRNFG